jgi:N-acetylglucosaminyldiphosphoundecaprenol N-acetyl-beta-D-mannosaminyltransferase
VASVAAIAFGRINEMASEGQEVLKGMLIPGRVNVLGVGIHSLDLPSAVELMESAVVSGRRGYVCVTDVRAIIEAQDNPSYLQVLNSSLLTVPDGRPSVWVGRAQGFSRMDQVAGPDLILEFCKLSSEKGYSQFFYGGAPGVAERLKDVLSQRFPGLKVVGTYTPPFRPLNGQEEKEVTELVARLRPDVTWIGLGAPKQELFMAKYLSRFDTTLMVGVGAAFDMHTGQIKDAPQWVKRLGFAWVHRLMQEPTRLWKRYLKSNPRFIWAITLQLLRLKKYDLIASRGQKSQGISSLSV